MSCEPCHGLSPLCCQYPTPEEHTISVEIEVNVLAATPDDDDIQEQVEVSLKEGHYNILTINGWHEPGLDN